MKSFIIKFGIFLTMILVAGIIMFIIQASAEEAEEKEPIDPRPTISVEILKSINHEVQITSFGELMPLESTELSAQVSGEVVSWNRNFIAGGVVKRDDILFTIEADAYEAAVLQSEAQISLAQASLTEELARQQVAMQEARNLPDTQISDLYLRKPQVLSAKAQLKSAEASLRIANRNLAKTKVRAPFDALVVSRTIGTGQFVNAGTRLAQLYNIETAEITIPIAGFDSQFVQNSTDKVTATISTQGRMNTTREGIVHRNLGVVDQNTRMQHLVIRIDDPYGLKGDLPSIQFGSYVEVSFAGKALNNVFKVPQSLVTNRKIWLVDTENKLESHIVEVIREEGTHFYISSGINENDRLVKNLPEYPQNGMNVKVLDAPPAIKTRTSAQAPTTAEARTTAEDKSAQQNAGQ